MVSEAAMLEAMRIAAAAARVSFSHLLSQFFTP
jgi:hypothetical protein